MVGYFFISLMVLFTMKEIFSLMFIFAFVFLRSGDISRKVTAKTDVNEHAANVFSLLFQVLDSSF